MRKILYCLLMIMPLFLYGEQYVHPALNPVCFMTPEEHAPLNLIENGRLRFAIVADLKGEKKFRGPEGNPLFRDQQSLLLATEALKKAFHECTGKIPVVIQPDDPELEKWPYWLVVGENQITDKLGMKPEALPFEGFEVRSFSRGIAVVGFDGFRIPGVYDFYDYRTRRVQCNGTENGAYDFIERILGVRYYYQDEGTVHPPLKQLSVTPVRYQDAPQYRTRTFGLAGMRGAYRQHSSSRFFGGESPHPFNMAKVFPDKLDTIFYRDEKGKLWQDSQKAANNMYDVTNPEFAVLLADAFAKYYKTQGAWRPLWGNYWVPNSEFLWFGQCDRSLELKNEIAKRLKRDNPEKCDSMSEVYGDFYYRFGKLLQERLPDVKVVFQAYLNYMMAPRKIDKFTDNVRIMACSGTPAMIRHPGYRAQFIEVYSGWNKLVKEKVTPYTYDAGWSPGAGIQLSVRGWFEGEFLRSMAPYINERECYPCISEHSLPYYWSIYLSARALWNPDFNNEAAMNEHWKVLFPENAAPLLKKFHDSVLDRWVNGTLPADTVVKRESLPGPHYKILYQTFPKEFLVEHSALLAKARQTAIPGTLEAARLERFIKPWRELFLSIIDKEQKFKTLKVRTGAIPKLENGALKFAPIAWNAPDYIDDYEETPCIGILPQPTNALAEKSITGKGLISFYMQNASNSENKAAFAEDKLHIKVPELLKRGGNLTLRARNGHSPLASNAEILAAETIKVRIDLNGKTVDEKELGLSRDKWVPLSFKLPAGCFQEGKNSLEIRNLTPLSPRGAPAGWLLIQNAEIDLNI